MVVDANVFKYVHSLDLWSEMVDLLKVCEQTIVTIRYVYAVELDSGLRPQLDDLVAAQILEIRQDPKKKRNPSKSERKCWKRIRRLSSSRPTSTTDDQLLFVAMHESLPLVTAENPLRALANECNHGRCYDVLDFVDALKQVALIDEQRRRRALSEWPEPPVQKTLDLVTVSEQRGENRFPCG